jgi:hypothetical protein
MLSSRGSRVGHLALNGDSMSTDYERDKLEALRAENDSVADAWLRRRSAGGVAEAIQTETYSRTAQTGPN